MQSWVYNRLIELCQLTTSPDSDLHISLKEGKFEWPVLFPKIGL